MWYYNGLDVCEYATAQHEHHKYPTVYLVFLNKVVFLCFAHYSCIGTMYSLPSTSMVVLMPHARVYSLGSSRGGCPSAVWLLTLFFLAGRLSHSCSWSVYIIGWIVPLFYTNLYVAGQKVHCLECMTDMLV